jgi:hypothetical protein
MNTLKNPSHDSDSEWYSKIYDLINSHFPSHEKIHPLNEYLSSLILNQNDPDYFGRSWQDALGVYFKLIHKNNKLMLLCLKSDDELAREIAETYLKPN